MVNLKTNQSAIYEESKVVIQNWFEENIIIYGYACFLKNLRENTRVKNNNSKEEK